MASEGVPADPEKVKQKLTEKDILAKLDAIQTQLNAKPAEKQGERRTGDGRGYRVYVPGAKGGAYESHYERARRESDESVRQQYVSEGIKNKRMAGDYLSAIHGLLKQNRDSFRAAVLLSDDFEAHIANGKAELGKAGKGGRLGAWKNVVLYIAVLAAAVSMVALTVGNAPVLKELTADLGSLQAQVEVIAVVSIVAAAFVLDRWWARRKANKP